MGLFSITDGIMLVFKSLDLLTEFVRNGRVAQLIDLVGFDSQFPLIVAVNDEVPIQDLDLYFCTLVYGSLICTTVHAWVRWFGGNRWVKAPNSTHVQVYASALDRNLKSAVQRGAAILLRLLPTSQHESVSSIGFRMLCPKVTDMISGRQPQVSYQLAGS